jgi:hypothetical protein
MQCHLEDFSSNLLKCLASFQLNFCGFMNKFYGVTSLMSEPQCFHVADRVIGIHVSYVGVVCLLGITAYRPLAGRGTHPQVSFRGSTDRLLNLLAHLHLDAIHTPSGYSHSCPTGSTVHLCGSINNIQTRLIPQWASARQSGGGILLMFNFNKGVKALKSERLEF